mmetsp:Transcript_72745/g.144203  ORF Transcript_72745/g.144203 Transcript_72745/m.144203 type:complete len:90 (+) Transcript_72745:125-394(+)
MCSAAAHGVATPINREKLNDKKFWHGTMLRSNDLQSQLHEQGVVGTKSAGWIQMVDQNNLQVTARQRSSSAQRHCSCGVCYPVIASKAG